MTHYHRGVYVGDGTDDNPWRPSGTDALEPGTWKAIDLRAVTMVGQECAAIAPEGPCLLATPERLSRVHGRHLGDTLDDFTANTHAGLASDLGVELASRQTAPALRHLIADLLIRHGNDARKDRWNQLKPEADGWRRIWLGECVHAGPPMFALSIADSFNRADNTNISTGAPFSWTETNGDCAIVSNAIQNVISGGGVGNECRAESDLASADHYAQLEGVFGTSVATNAFFAYCRFSSSARTAYRFGYPRNAGSSMSLTKLVAGASTVLASATTALTISATSTGQIVHLEVSGSSLSGSMSTDTLAVTDTAITTGTRTGLNLNANGAARTNADSFSAADLGGGPAADTGFLVMF